MTTATLRLPKKIQARAEALNLPGVNWKIVFFAGFFVAAIALVFYALQVNDLTKGYYLINGYDKKISQLSDENKNLEVSFAENSFMSTALAKAQSLNFQKTTSVKYIQVTGDTFTAVNIK